MAIQAIYIYIIDGDIKCTDDCVDDRKVDGDGIHSVDRYRYFERYKWKEPPLRIVRYRIYNGAKEIEIVELSTRWK